MSKNDTTPTNGHTSNKKKSRKGPQHEPVPSVTPDMITAPEEAPAEQPSSTETLPSAPAELTAFRLRMKVWTDPTTTKRYLMPSAFMRDVKHGKPVTDVMYAYALSDEDTKIITLTVIEWNTLPFFYFKEDGEAPRMSRPADTVQINTKESP